MDHPIVEGIGSRRETGEAAEFSGIGRVGLSAKRQRPRGTPSTGVEVLIRAGCAVGFHTGPGLKADTGHLSVPMRGRPSNASAV